jgi:hypothetical protein
MCFIGSAVAALIFVALMAPQPCTAQQADQRVETPVRQTVGGPVLDGFMLTLRSDPMPAHLHGPIWVDAELRNVSGQSKVGWFGPRYLYEFKIQSESGAVVPRNPYATFGADPYQHDYIVPPNGTMTGRFRLDLLYSFTAPGAYSVQITRAWAKIDSTAPSLQSNAITMMVLP